MQNELKVQSWFFSKIFVLLVPKPWNYIFRLNTEFLPFIGWSNSSMNWIIYACWSRDFRRWVYVNLHVNINIHILGTKIVFLTATLFHDNKITINHCHGYIDLLRRSTYTHAVRSHFSRGEINYFIHVLFGIPHGVRGMLYFCILN